MRADGRIDPARIGGSGAAVSYVLTWDGANAVWSATSGGGGDTTHPGTGDNSTAVGAEALASSLSTAALGYTAEASGDYSTALGAGAWASGALAVAAGWGSTASGARSIAIGASAICNVNDRAMVKANDLEVARSNNATATGTSIILRDTDTGTRYRLSIASGALVIAAA